MRSRLRKGDKVRYTGEYHEVWGNNYTTDEVYTVVKTNTGNTVPTEHKGSPTIIVEDSEGDVLVYMMEKNFELIEGNNMHKEQDWTDKVGLIYTKEVSNVQINLSGEQARFLATILGKCNGSDGQNKLSGLYSHLTDHGVEGYDTDLESIDTHNSYFK